VVNRYHILILQILLIHEYVSLNPFVTSVLFRKTLSWRELLMFKEKEEKLCPIMKTFKMIRLHSKYSTGWRPEPFVYSVMFEYVNSRMFCFVRLWFYLARRR
jgi:hypothetical protein